MIMKKKILMVSSVVTLCLCTPILSAASEPENDMMGAVVYEYAVQDSETVVFTMDLFNETYTRADVADFVKLEKAKSSAATNEYRSYTVSEEEIDAVYERMEQIAARAPALNYYFSRVYWQFRTDSYYGPNTISLTLVPTNVTKNNNYLDVTMASWALVKAECRNSQYWTNERSMEQQFCCHALGEIYYPGDVGYWDLEPIRPYKSLIEYAVNRCNPVG